MDDDIKIETKKKSFWKEKISRFKPIQFLTKNIIVISIVLIFSLSLLFKVWDIKKYEIYDLDGKDINPVTLNEIEKYVEENVIGENYFAYSTIQSQNDLYSKVSAVKSIRIEKVIPNKILIFIQVYDPKYVAELKSNSCYVLCSEGFVLEQICEEEDISCCSTYSLEKEYPLLKSSSIDVSQLEGGKVKLLMMDEIGKVVKIVEAFKYEVKEIKVENDILEVADIDGKVFRFAMSDDIEIQLKRYIAVVGRIKSDSLEFSNLDLRFERPVMK